MAALCADYRTATLTAAERGMLQFAVKLTRHSSAVQRSDVLRLRELGFDDAAIHDIVQITALFNYYNRLAGGLGLEPESGGAPGRHGRRRDPR